MTPASPRPSEQERIRFALSLLLGLALTACQPAPAAHEARICSPEERAADESSSAPRPPEAEATSSFPGNMPEQVEFVWIKPTDRYHYAERWNIGVADVNPLQLNMGWDWKVNCRIERCEQPGGRVCCYQVCADGGKHGVPTEPPDQFGCMNASAGGRYQWFLDGLHEAGIQGLEGCAGPASDIHPAHPGRQSG